MPTVKTIDRMPANPDAELATRLLDDGRERVNAALEQCLDNAGSIPDRLRAAMQYAVLGNGKRLRPVLVYAAGAALGMHDDRLDAPACAVEFIHAYSLVHDDLPAMDDDDLRRGEPTCHRRFDEATAILTGDALQSLAFEVLAGDETAHAIPAASRNLMTRRLAVAAGAAGMAGGQAIDLDLENSAGPVSREQLEYLHRHKTGALIRASIALGALAAEAEQEQLEQLDRYGRAIGLACQIVFQNVLQDTLGLSDSEATWSYTLNRSIFTSAVRIGSIALRPRGRSTPCFTVY